MSCTEQMFIEHFWCIRLGGVTHVVMKKATEKNLPSLSLLGKWGKRDSN